jgi:hypothetical protein
MISLNIKEPSGATLNFESMQDCRCDLTGNGPIRREPPRKRVGVGQSLCRLEARWNICCNTSDRIVV